MSEVEDSDVSDGEQNRKRREPKHKSKPRHAKTNKKAKRIEEDPTDVQTTQVTTRMCYITGADAVKLLTVGGGYSLGVENSEKGFSVTIRALDERMTCAGGGIIPESAGQPSATFTTVDSMVACMLTQEIPFNEDLNFAKSISTLSEYEISCLAAAIPRCAKIRQDSKLVPDNGDKPHVLKLTPATVKILMNTVLISCNHLLTPRFESDPQLKGYWDAVTTIYSKIIPDPAKIAQFMTNRREPHSRKLLLLLQVETLLADIRFKTEQDVVIETEKKVRGLAAWFNPVNRLLEYTLEQKGLADMIASQAKTGINDELIWDYMNQAKSIFPSLRDAPMPDWRSFVGDIRAAVVDAQRETLKTTRSQAPALDPHPSAAEANLRRTDFSRAELAQWPPQRGNLYAFASDENFSSKSANIPAGCDKLGIVAMALNLAMCPKHAGTLAEFEQIPEHGKVWVNWRKGQLNDIVKRMCLEYSMTGNFTRKDEEDKIIPQKPMLVYREMFGWICHSLFSRVSTYDTKTRNPAKGLPTPPTTYVHFNDKMLDACDRVWIVGTSHDEPAFMANIELARQRLAHVLKTSYNTYLFYFEHMMVENDGQTCLDSAETFLRDSDNINPAVLKPLIASVMTVILTFVNHEKSDEFEIQSKQLFTISEKKAVSKTVDLEESDKLFKAFEKAAEAASVACAAYKAAPGDEVLATAALMYAKDASAAAKAALDYDPENQMYQSNVVKSESDVSVMALATTVIPANDPAAAPAEAEAAVPAEAAAAAAATEAAAAVPAAAEAAAAVLAAAEAAAAVPAAVLAEAPAEAPAAAEAAAAVLAAAEAAAAVPAAVLAEAPAEAPAAAEAAAAAAATEAAAAVTAEAAAAAAATEATAAVPAPSAAPAEAPAEAPAAAVVQAPPRVAHTTTTTPKQFKKNLTLSMYENLSAYHQILLGQEYAQFPQDKTFIAEFKTKCNLTVMNFSPPEEPLPLSWRIIANPEDPDRFTKSDEFLFSIVSHGPSYSLSTTIQPLITELESLDPGNKKHRLHALKCKIILSVYQKLKTETYPVQFTVEHLVKIFNGEIARLRRERPTFSRASPGGTPQRR